MVSEAWSWEPRLRELADIGRRVERSTEAVPKRVPGHDLADAYDLAERITRQHSRSFHLASGLLPGPTRRAIRSLYAFCRVTDNLVDEDSGQGAAESLAAWQAGELDALGEQAILVMAAWRDTQTRYGIPQGYADQLISGVRMDLNHNRYQTFDDLAAYAYRVASTVGLMSMHILGFQGPEAVPYAVKMGVALQLTNILRDVGEDWRMGRLYLPLNELDAFGLAESDIDEGVVTPAWRSYMRFAIERNRQVYEQAWPGLGLLSSAGRRSVGAAAELYRGILDAIEALDYDVFHHRAHLDRWEKIRRLSRVLAPGAIVTPASETSVELMLGAKARHTTQAGLRHELVSRGSSSA
jgi:phytoene synthase